MSTRSIYKFTIKPGERKTIDLPVDAGFLHTAWQHDTCAIWFLVDPMASVRYAYTFEVFGTGWEINIPNNHPLSYLGTCLADDGDHVWHVFEHSSRKPCL
jgi:hypothetical protein